MVRLGFVVSTYHARLTERMAEAATKRARKLDADVVETVTVPGTYDTVLAADRVARRSDVDAVVVIGVIIEGETDHDEVIGQAVATQLHQVSLDRDTPVTFGITGPGMTASTARERIDYAPDAVEAAVELVEEFDDRG